MSCHYRLRWVDGFRRTLWLVMAMTTTVFCQTTHTVVVGVAGSFYDPPTVSAQVNDTVNFVFGGDAHGVTQTTFAAPCWPLEGGFSSGLAGRGPELNGPTLSWSLIIQNASQPIWFFCENMVPSSHCAAGMVGVINPPSIDSYQSFVVAAKAVTDQPMVCVHRSRRKKSSSSSSLSSPSLSFSSISQPVPTAILSGVGAFATAPPSAPVQPSSLSSPPPPPTSIPPLPSSSSVAPPQIAQPDSQPLSSFETHRAAIIGGIVGGISLLLLAALSVYLITRRNSPSSSTPGIRYDRRSRDFFEYRVNKKSSRYSTDPLEKTLAQSPPPRSLRGPSPLYPVRRQPSDLVVVYPGGIQRKQSATRVGFAMGNHENSSFGGTGDEGDAKLKDGGGYGAGLGFGLPAHQTQHQTQRQHQRQHQQMQVMDTSLLSPAGSADRLLMDKSWVDMRPSLPPTPSSANLANNNGSGNNSTQGHQGAGNGGSAARAGQKGSNLDVKGPTRGSGTESPAHSVGSRVSSSGVPPPPRYGFVI